MAMEKHDTDNAPWSLAEQIAAASDHNKFSADTDTDKMNAATLFARHGSDYNIFDPSDPDVAKISNYLKTILVDRIFPAFMHDERMKSDIDPNKLEVVLFNSGSGFAARFPNSNVIGVSLDAVIASRYQSEDIVAQSLSHELLHRHWAEFSNDKMQEGVAEWRSVATLHRAGYAPEVVLDKTSNSVPKSLEECVKQYRDEHIAPHYNRRLFETAISKLRADVGKLKTSLTQLPSEIGQHIDRLITRQLENDEGQRLQAASRVHDYLRDKGTFKKENPVNQLNDILEYLESTPRISPEDVKQISSAMNQIKLNPQDRSQRDAMLSVLNFLTAPGSEGKFGDTDMLALYQNAFGTNFFGDKLPTDSNMGKLIQAYNVYFRPKDYDDAKQAAEEIITLKTKIQLESYRNTYKINEAYLKQEPLVGFCDKISEDEISLISYGNHDRPFTGKLDTPIRLPWHQHLAFAQKEHSETGHSSIAKVGIELTRADPIFVELSHASEREIDNAKFYGVQYPGNWFALGNPIPWDNIGRDSKGCIVSSKDSITSHPHNSYDGHKEELEREMETALVADRRLGEQEAVEKTDWSTFRQAPMQFALKHKTLLMPHMGFVHDQHPFIERFFKEINALEMQQRDAFLKDFLNTDYASQIAGVRLVDLLQKAHKDYNHGHCSRAMKMEDADRWDHRVVYGVGLPADHPYLQLVETANISPTTKTCLKSHMKPFEKIDGDIAFHSSHFDIKSLFPAPETFMQMSLSEILHHKAFDSDHEFPPGAITYRNTLIAERISLGNLDIELPTLLEVKHSFDEDISKLPEQTRYARQSALASLVEQYVDSKIYAQLYENTQSVPKTIKSLSSQQLQSIITTIKALDERNLFLGLTDKKTEIIEAVIEAIHKLEDPLVRKDLVEKILTQNSFGSQLNYSANPPQYHGITNARQLEKLGIMYADSTAGIIGIDDPARRDYSDFLLRAREQINDVCNKFDVGSQYRILKRFAEKSEFQKELAYETADLIQRNRIRFGNRYAVFGGGAEAALDFINRDDEIRKAVLKYLRNKPGPTETRDLANLLIRQKGNAAETFSSFTGIPEKKLQETFINMDLEHIRYLMQERLREVHENFWQLPLEARGLVMDLILFPARDDYKHDFEKRKKGILDELLPTVEVQSGGSKTRNSQEVKSIAREFIESFLKHSEIEDQRIILSHLYVAGEPGEVIGLSVGRAIKEVLSTMGPAGDKLSQAIANHPDTPDDIRNELNETKIKASDDPRWETIRNIERAMEAPLEETEIRRVGPALGSGSIAVTTLLEWKNGNKTASSVMKPDIEGRGHYRFNQLRDTARDVIKRHPSLAMVNEMVEQAACSFDYEIDMNKARIQAKIAQALYDDTKIKVGKTTVHFSAAPWKGHKGRIKHAGVVEGLHFLELPEETSEQITTKKRIAKAILTLELCNMLSGKAFDCDRHDGQQRITISGNNIYVGNFDFGGVLTAEPTDNQKNAFASALYESLIARPSDKDFSSTFATKMRDVAAQHQDDPSVRDYLSAINRGLLALGNYAKILSPGENTAVLLSVLNLKEQSLDIMNRIRRDHPADYRKLKLYASAKGIMASEQITLTRDSAHEVEAKGTFVEMMERTPAGVKIIDHGRETDDFLDRVARGEAEIPDGRKIDEKWADLVAQSKLIAPHRNGPHGGS